MNFKHLSVMSLFGQKFSVSMLKFTKPTCTVNCKIKIRPDLTATSKEETVK